MKIPLAAFLLMLSLSGGFAQDDLTLETSRTEAEARRAEQRKLEARERAVRAMQQPLVTYRGFFIDLGQAQDKAKFLSLRQPVDPKNDLKHVYLDERSARPKGFVLFGLSF